MKVQVRPRRVGTLAAATSLILLTIPTVGSGSQFGLAPASQGPTPPQEIVPTFEDADAIGAAELKLLPADAVQVDCAPGMRTAPPFTRPSRGQSAHQLFILSDGRCFEWDGPDPRLIVEPIEDPIRPD
jgi:hypothetical protein